LVEQQEGESAMEEFWSILYYIPKLGVDVLTPKCDSEAWCLVYNIKSSSCTLIIKQERYSVRYRNVVPPTISDSHQPIDAPIVSVVLHGMSAPQADILQALPSDSKADKISMDIFLRSTWLMVGHLALIKS